MTFIPSHYRRGVAEPANPAAHRDPLAGSSDRRFAPSEDDLKGKVVAIARTWLGTPYRHQGATKHAGCDCLGLIRGVWRELYGREAQTPPPYRPDWAEVCATEPMLGAARRWLRERPLQSAEPGDVLLFRMSPQAAIKHCAILSAAPTPDDPHPRMIHAYWGRAVVESWMGPWWRRRLAAAFAYPVQARHQSSPPTRPACAPT